MIHEANSAAPVESNGTTGDNVVVTESASGISGVTVKGWRNGLLLILPPDGTWDSVMQQVHTKLDEAKARSFWRGSQTTIDCGMRVVPRPELSSLTDFIKRAFGLVPVAVVASDEGTRAAGQQLGLAPYSELPIVRKPARVTEPEPEREPERDVAEKESSVARSPYFPNNALYVPNTLRSGQRVMHDGHLIICGD
ncbi:MAG: hypothetical protein SFU56_04205, partial [Capsulimonadales bacterium]|nr:hypothetical protein [Capsulimonadales bacterium]